MIDNVESEMKLLGRDANHVTKHVLHHKQILEDRTARAS